MTRKLLSGQRILVVEDEMLILLTVEGMLSDLGCDAMSVAVNVEQALAHLDRQKFDAAMLDVNLSGKKSYPVADALAALGVPFMFSTGYRGESLDARYRDRPMLGKPYRRADLVAMFTALQQQPQGGGPKTGAEATRAGAN